MSDAYEIGTAQEVIGANLRSRRLALNLRQEELARRLRVVGATWTQSTVAGIERGSRRVTVEELILICLALECSPSDLFAGEGWVELAKHSTGPREAIRKILDGQATHSLLRQIASPTSAVIVAEAAFIEPRLRHLDGFDATMLRDALIASQGEAERKAAKRLGVFACEVVTVSYLLWGRSLTAERDALAAAASDADTSADALRTIRRHTTRDLIRLLELWEWETRTPEVEHEAATQGGEAGES